MTDPGRQAARRVVGSDLALLAGFVVAAALSVLAAGLPRAAPAAGLAAIAIFIARVDWRDRIIPNPASLSAAVLALVEALLDEQPQAAALEAILRGATTFLLFLGFRWAFRIWRGRDGLGLGDVKLAGVAGLWLDWPRIPIAVELACGAALAYVLICWIVSGQPVDALAKLPFGAFLAPAIWVTWISEFLAF